MPTPVTTARQCLTPDAARALEDAVAVAVRRSHVQTTSLHAISALLGLPASTLREACSRSRLQFRALELCVSVSLDRLPTAKSVEEPPVSNSLMAAIKRSQANQRRQPESFHFYQQMQLQNPTSALTCIKVELKQFILSILDDPIVSRVFEEAGFRGSDIKFSIIHPPPVSRFSRSIAAPLRFNFPFRVDENFNRIGEVLARKTSKNPILIGICADDALSSFSESVNRGKTTDLPAEIEGLRVISISSEIREFVGNGGNKEKIDLKMKEISDKMENCSGVAFNYGEVMVFLNGGLADYVVTSLSRLIGLYPGKLWLIGTASSDETYKKFLLRFPSIEQDWDLCVLPITSSTKTHFGGGSFSKSSLMGSFVPFGGFFPTPLELQNPVSGTSKSDTRCKQCEAKYNQEASLLISGKPSVSVADSNRSTNLPFWLQKEDSLTTKISKTIEASDGGTVLKARLKGLQRKWNDKCGRLHKNQPFLNTGPYFLQSGLEKMKEKDSDSDSASLLHQTRSPNSCTTSVTTDLGLGTISPPIPENSRKPGFLENPKKPGFQENPREPEFQDRQRNRTVLENPRSHNFLECRQNIPGPVFLDRLSVVASDTVAGEKDFKYLYRVLAEKVGWQDEAISAISATLSRCRNGERRRRGDIWIGFLGPDKIGKRLIAEELSRIMFGSRENFITADLSSEEEHRVDSNSAFYCQGLCGSGVSFRGKTVIDYIADELRNKPNSVVFLENVDKADFVAQSCLSSAIKTGKFQDSHMREVSMKNAVFVITSSEIKIEKVKSGKILPEYSEERILEAKCTEMQIVVEHFDGGNLVKNTSSNVFIKPRKKRKLTETLHPDEKEISQEKPKRICLDLNLPVEEDDADSDSSSETRVPFFQDFLEKMDEKVFFNPVHFDSRAKEILKRIDLCLKYKLGFNAFLEIDDDPLVQILAADWISGCKNGVENWVESVLYKALVEAKQKHDLESKFIMKLVSDSDADGDSESRVCGCLPAKITVNSSFL